MKPKSKPLKPLQLGMHVKPAKPVREPGPELIGKKELALLNSLRGAGLLSPPLEAMAQEDFPSLEVAYQHSHDTTVALLLVPGDGLLVGAAKRMATDAPDHARGRAVAFGKAIQARRVLHGFIGGSALKHVWRMELRFAGPELVEKFLTNKPKGPRYPVGGPKTWEAFSDLGLHAVDIEALKIGLKSPCHIWAPKKRFYILSTEKPWGMTTRSGESLRDWIKANGGAESDLIEPDLIWRPEDAAPKRRPGRPRKVAAQARAAKPAHKAAKKTVRKLSAVKASKRSAK